MWKIMINAIKVRNVRNLSHLLRNTCNKFLEFIAFFCNLRLIAINRISRSRNSRFLQKPFTCLQLIHIEKTSHLQFTSTWFISTDSHRHHCAYSLATGVHHEIEGITATVAHFINKFKHFLQIKWTSFYVDVSQRDHVDMIHIDVDVKAPLPWVT